MGSVPIFQNPYGPNGSSPSQIDKVVGTAYEVVREVAENLEYIKHVSAHLSQVYTVAINIEAINTISIYINELLALYENLDALLAHGPAAVIVAPSIPAGPFMQGQMWWNSTTGNLYAWYVDVDSGQFVQINTQGGIITSSGTGAPNGFVTAPIGALYTRLDGGAGTTLYVKESGTGNTGWVAK